MKTFTPTLPSPLKGEEMILKKLLFPFPLPRGEGMKGRVSKKAVSPTHIPLFNPPLEIKRDQP